MAIEANDVIVPLDVPKPGMGNYIKNYLTITRKSGRLMLFAGDQKVEHLNDDFYGDGIQTDDNDPEHNDSFLLNMEKECRKRFQDAFLAREDTGSNYKK